VDSFWSEAEEETVDISYDYGRKYGMTKHRFKTLLTNFRLASYRDDNLEGVGVLLIL